jgi:hypothetical protein
VEPGAKEFGLTLQELLYNVPVGVLVHHLPAELYLVEQEAEVEVVMLAP